MEEFRPDNLLCIVAHPDDVEVTAGGTIAKWAAAGTTISFLICSDGSKGTSDVTKSHEIARQRAREEAEAARILGVSCWHQLDYCDGELEVNDALRGDISRAIRAHKPDTVFTMDPTFYYSTKWSYVNHRDHRAVGEATLDAVYPMARDASALPELLHEDYQPHSVNTLLFAHFEKENFLVDISEYIDIKRAALEAHVSQFGDAHGVTSFVTNRAREEGRAINVEMAEGFIKLAVFS